MKVNIQGYDVDCTPEELNDFLRLQNHSVKQVPPSYPSAPYVDGGQPWWGIYPPKFTCNATTALLIDKEDAKEFADKIISDLKSRGTNLRNSE